MKRGLAREDVFLVGIEIAMTESMAHCDIVLPAATHFECDDLYPAYGHHWLQRAEAVIPPVGEALPNTEIFRRLAARFGFDDACFKAGDRELMDDAIDGAHPHLRGVKPSALPTREALRMAAPDGRPLALFDNVMPGTPSGKIELASDLLAQRWGPQARLPAYRPRAGKFPLALISPASDKRISSTLLGSGGGARPSLDFAHAPGRRACARPRSCAIRAGVERSRRGDPAAADHGCRIARRGRIGKGRLARNEHDRTDHQRAGLGR